MSDILGLEKRQEIEKLLDNKFTLDIIDIDEIRNLCDKNKNLYQIFGVEYIDEEDFKQYESTVRRSILKLVAKYHPDKLLSQFKEKLMEHNSDIAVAILASIYSGELMTDASDNMKALYTEYTILKDLYDTLSRFLNTCKDLLTSKQGRDYYNAYLKGYKAENSVTRTTKSKYEMDENDPIFDKIFTKETAIVEQEYEYVLQVYLKDIYKGTVKEFIPEIVVGESYLTVNDKKVKFKIVGKGKVSVGIPKGISDNACITKMHIPMDYKIEILDDSFSEEEKNKIVSQIPSFGIQRMNIMLVIKTKTEKTKERLTRINNNLILMFNKKEFTSFEEKKGKITIALFGDKITLSNPKIIEKDEQKYFVFEGLGFHNELEQTKGDLIVQYVKSPNLA